LFTFGCGDEQPFTPVPPPETLVWQTFPATAAGARVFVHPATVMGYKWRVVLDPDSVLKLQGVRRVPLSRSDAIAEYRWFYAELDSILRITSDSLGSADVVNATAKLRGDTLDIRPVDPWEWPLNIPLRFFRDPPSPNTPPAGGFVVFSDGGALYGKWESQYVLYDNRSFTLQFVGAFEYRGTYSQLGDIITFAWSGAVAWGATATLSGDTLAVKYNEMMVFSDFVDGNYIRR
jgi:hypothetical protein